MARRSLVLHSGGMDSTVCMLIARDQGADVVSLGIDYGQRHRIELQTAARLCEKFGIPRTVVSINWDKPHREIPTDRDLEQIRASVSPAFLPGRNLLFLAIASAEAAGIGADEVWIGINEVDFSGYPDCTSSFLHAFREVITVAMPDPLLSIEAPLLNMSKPEIASLAARLGLKQGDTWSCYQPVETPTGMEPCGRCDACVLHEYAWAQVRDLDTQ